MDLLEHITEQYGSHIGNPANLRFAESSSAEYPRVVGDLPDGTSVVVYTRFTGPDNAGKYRYWATIPKRIFEAMHNRPDSMAYWLLQIGKMDDGNPWWSALYRESDLATGSLDELDRFYRANPRIVRPVATYDFIQQSIWQDGELTVAPEGQLEREIWMAELDRLEQALPDLPGSVQLDIDNRMLRIRQATRRRLESARA